MCVALPQAAIFCLLPARVEYIPQPASLRSCPPGVTLLRAVHLACLNAPVALGRFLLDLRTDNGSVVWSDGLFEPFIYINALFTKTGLGQT